MWVAEVKETQGMALFGQRVAKYRQAWAAWERPCVHFLQLEEVGTPLATGAPVWNGLPFQARLEWATARYRSNSNRNTSTQPQ